MNTFETYGTIVFDPPEQTDKQRRQAVWKKIALIQIDLGQAPYDYQNFLKNRKYDIPTGDLSAYYAWHLNKEHKLVLTSPLRGAHITFINDSHRDMGDGINNWEKLKKEWDGKQVPVTLSIDPHTDGSNWWLIIPHNERASIQFLRNQVGLGKPEHGLHMTIGTAVDSKPPYDKKDNNIQRAKEMNLAHSKYIQELYYNEK